MPVRTAVYPDMGWTLLQTYDLAYSPDIAKSSIMDRFLRGALNFVNIEHLNNRNWYLAQYNTAGKNRESLFSWLNEQNVVPWTPLITRKIRRADSRRCYRERIFAIFRGYFFILANFDIQPVSALRRHSAFIDFVKFGGEIKTRQ